MKRFVQLLFADCTSESGQTMAEYAVTLTVITLAVVLAIAALTTSIISDIQRVITSM